MVGADGFYRKKFYLEGESWCLQRGLADKCKEKILFKLYCHLPAKSQRGHTVYQDAPASRLVCINHRALIVTHFSIKIFFPGDHTRK